MMACALMAGTARAANDAARWNRCRCRRLRTGRDTATLPWRRKEHRISSDGASLTDAAAGVVRGSAPVQSSAAPWAMACRGSKRVMMAADEGHHNAHAHTCVSSDAPLETARQTAQPCIRERRTTRNQAKDFFSAPASLFQVGWRASWRAREQRQRKAPFTTYGTVCNRSSSSACCMPEASEDGRIREEACATTVVAPPAPPACWPLAGSASPSFAFPAPLQQRNSVVRAQTHSQPCR